MIGCNFRMLLELFDQDLTRFDDRLIIILTRYTFNANLTVAIQQMSFSCNYIFTKYIDVDDV